MRQRFFALLLVLLTATSVSAQVSIPNTFVANTRIVSADMNANFTELGDKALNRTGGTATGDIVFATKIVPDADGGADIGTAALKFNIGYFEDLDVETLTLGTVANLVVSSIANDSILTAGGITAGSGAVGIVGVDGKIPAISSTYFASLNGANITALSEANITDGAILARVASAETITAQWVFTPSGAPVLWNASAGTSNAFAVLGRASDEQSRLLFLSNNAATNFGAIQADTDVISVLVGAALGSTVTFTPTAVTNATRYNSAAAQPGFLAYKNAAGVVIDGATVDFDTEVYDETNNFLNDTFTAPVTGRYLLCFGIDYIAQGSGEAHWRLIVDGTTYQVVQDSNGSELQYASTCIYAPMSAASTALVNYTHPGLDSADYAISGVSGRSTYFSGRLVP